MRVLNGTFCVSRTVRFSTSAALPAGLGDSGAALLGAGVLGAGALGTGASDAGTARPAAPPAGAGGESPASAACVVRAGPIAVPRAVIPDQQVRRYGNSGTYRAHSPAVSPRPVMPHAYRAGSARRLFSSP